MTVLFGFSPAFFRSPIRSLKTRPGSTVDPQTVVARGGKRTQDRQKATIPCRSEVKPHSIISSFPPIGISAGEDPIRWRSTLPERCTPATRCHRLCCRTATPRAGKAPPGDTVRRSSPNTKNRRPRQGAPAPPLIAPNDRSAQICIRSTCQIPFQDRLSGL